MDCIANVCECQSLARTMVAPSVLPTTPWVPDLPRPGSRRLAAPRPIPRAEFPDFVNALKPQGFKWKSSLQNAHFRSGVTGGSSRGSRGSWTPSRAPRASSTPLTLPGTPSAVAWISAVPESSHRDNLLSSAWHYHVLIWIGNDHAYGCMRLSCVMICACGTSGFPPVYHVSLKAVPTFTQHDLSVGQYVG